MSRFCYIVAGISIKVCLQENQRIEREEPYHFFSVNPETKAICCDHIVAAHVDQLDLCNNDPVFSDGRNRVYLVQGKFYRYQGPLMNAYPETWRSCQAIDPTKPNEIQVYLRTMENLLPEGNLVEALGLDYLLGQRGKVMLHASFIEYQGRGILFTAPSGTGKSTQADLWTQVYPETTIINGDRAVFGVEDGMVMGYGMPFCGSSGIALNRSCPVQAIVVLRQGKFNQVQRLTGAKAAQLLLSECVLNPWDRQVMDRVMDTVTQVVERCPIYLYHCLPDATAVEFLRRIVFEGGTRDE